MTETAARRVVLYGHDTMGLGHLRRNLALAGTLTEAGDVEVLLVTGTPEAGRFPLPPRTDLLVLPGIAKDDDGAYRSRRWSTPLRDTLALRGAVLTAALTAFAPHLLVVDKVARGFGGELEGVLPALREQGTRVVLGLRDILDAPSAAALEWRRLGTTEAVRAWYDEVWVYGDRRLADVGVDARLPPSVRRMVRHTGLLAGCRPCSRSGPPPAPGRFVLCLLGGGQDGAALADLVAATVRPAGTDAVVVAGPHLPDGAREALHSRAVRDPGLHVVDFCADPRAWARRAAAVVCMGGYNTLAELLTTDTPVLAVPRTRPRAEQLVRARRLSAAGLVDDAHPDDLTADVLAHWLAAAAGRRHPRAGVDLDGLARVRHLAAEHLAGGRDAA